MTAPMTQRLTPDATPDATPHLTPPAPIPRYQLHHYPASLIETRALAGGRVLTLRPILPQDDELLALLVRELAPQARRNRFHGAVKLAPAHLRQMSNVDYQRQMAVVVTTQIEGAERLIADARYCVAPDGRSAEFALVVAEGWQRLGVGAWVMNTLQQAATRAGLEWLQGDVLQGNLPMLGLMQRCGFALCPDGEDDAVVKVQRRLGVRGAATPGARHGLRSWLHSSWLKRASPGSAFTKAA